MVKKYNRPKIVRLNDELFDYIERESKKGFEFSPWVREKLIERMEKDPYHIKHEIEKRKTKKEKMNSHFDVEITTLMGELDAAEKLQEEQKKRRESITPDYEPYGGEHKIDWKALRESDAEKKKRRSY